MRGKNRSCVYTATRPLPKPRLNHPHSNTCEQSVRTFSYCLWCVCVSILILRKFPGVHMVKETGHLIPQWKNYY